MLLNVLHAVGDLQLLHTTVLITLLYSLSCNISVCSLTSPNYKGADAAVYAVTRPHRTGMSIFQELTPYPRGYEYFPGSGQATNWLMYGCLGSTGFSVSR